MADMKDIREIRRDNLLIAKSRLGTYAAVARAAEVSQAYLSQIKNRVLESKTGNPKGMGDDVAERIALALGESKAWMDHEHPEELQGIVGEDEGHSASKKTGLFDDTSGDSGIKIIRKTDTLPGPTMGEKLPLLTWDQARTWETTLMDLLAEKDVEKWLLCPTPHSSEAFCLENNTDAMDDGTRNGYREGEILFIDPAVEAEPGRDVIVIFPDGRMTLRRLKEDTEGRYLLSLNGKRIERWQDGTRVRGVVIFSGGFR